MNNQQPLNLEDRHVRKVTLIASQLPVTGCFDLFKEATLVDVRHIDLN